MKKLFFYIVPTIMFSALTQEHIIPKDASIGTKILVGAVILPAAYLLLFSGLARLSKIVVEKLYERGFFL